MPLRDLLIGRANCNLAIRKPVRHLFGPSQGSPTLHCKLKRTSSYQNLDFLIVLRSSAIPQSLLSPATLLPGFPVIIQTRKPNKFIYRSSHCFRRLYHCRKYNLNLVFRKRIPLELSYSSLYKRRCQCCRHQRRRYNISHQLSE